MFKLVQILNCPELPYYPVLKFVFKEIGNAIVTDYNGTVVEVNNLNDLKDEGVVFMGNNFNDSSKHAICNHLSKFNNVIFIGWYWQDMLEEIKNIKKFIHVAENKKFLMYDYDIQRFKILNSLKNYTPLILRPDDNPDKIGTYERNVTWDYCFMGHTYRENMVPSKKYKGIYHATGDFSRYLSYDERRYIYLASKYALGFHSEISVHEKSIAQRVFEGMAYGCIVLTCNPQAEIDTDGIAVYVKDREDLESKMEYYNSHEDEYLDKQRKGYEWIKKYGTNRYSWSLIFDKINELGYEMI